MSSLVFKNTNASSVSTPFLGKTTLFVDDNGQLTIKDDNGNTEIIATGNLGSNTQVLFNDSGNIVGNANLTFNKSTQVLTVGGNVSATYFIGNGSQLTGIDATAIQNGTSNVRTFLDSNVAISAAGNANIVIVTGTGANITGTANVTGNLSAANVAGGNIVSANFVTGTLTTAAQPNITSVGTLSSLTATGNISGGNLLGPHANGNSNVNIPSANGNVNISAAGNANIVVVTGTGANITGTANITGNLVSGNISANIANLTTANITGNLSAGNITTGSGSGGNISGANVITANTFSGNLTGNVTGILTGNVANGNSVISIPAANGNVNISAVGNANILVVTGTGINVAGTLNATGNANVGNLGATRGAFTNVSGEGGNISNIQGGNVSGAVASATAATNAAALLQNTSTATTVYPTFTTSSANGNSSAVINTGISANLSNASITATTFVGALSGAATSATSATNAAAVQTNASTATTIYLAGTTSTSNGNLALNVVSGIYANMGNNAITATTFVGNIQGTGNSNVGNLGTATAIITANANVTGNVNANNLSTTNKITAGNGLQVTTGGASITGNIDVTGNFNVTGNLNYSNVTDLVVGDPLIYMGANNTGDIVDLGIVASYNNGTYYHTGIARNASNDYWTFFDGVVQEPTTVIDWANATYPTVKLGNLIATGTANVTGNANVGNIGATNAVFTNVSGNGSALTALNASNISSGTLDQARLANSSLTVNGTAISLGGSGTITANTTQTLTFGSYLTGTSFNGGTANTIAVDATSANTASKVVARDASGNFSAGTITATLSGSATSAGTATTAGTVTTNAQPNITSVGTLTSLGVNGTVTAVAFTANTGVFTGNGSGLSAIAGANVTGTVSSATSATTAGTVTTAAQPNITSVGTLTALTISNGSEALRLAGSSPYQTWYNAAQSTRWGYIQHTGTNLAINNDLNGNLVFGTNNTVRGLFDGSGNFGVGTTAPKTKFQVTGAVNLNAPVLGNATNAPLYITNTDEGYGLVVGTNASDGHVWLQAQRTDTGTTPYNITLNEAGGNVGIGTNSPAYKLVVSNSGAAGIEFSPTGGVNSGAFIQTYNRSGAAYVDLTTYSGNVFWSNGSATNMSLLATGNVGIGTAAPGYKLEVNGTSYFGGNVTVKSNIAYVSPNGANTITSVMANGGTLYWTGTSGQLFSITDSMTGNIFTVNDVSGIPMISVDAGGNIQLAASGGFVAYGVSTGVSAGGTVQANATAITRPINVVSTVASGAGIILPTVPAGARIIIVNTSANALNVYPPSGAAVNSAATNAAYSQPAGARLEFFSVSSTQWYTLNATYG